MRDTERERERGRNTGRGRNRPHARSPMWDSILGLQDHPWAKGRCTTTEPPRRPITWNFLRTGTHLCHCLQRETGSQGLPQEETYMEFILISREIFFKDFIYLFMRDTHTQRQGHRQREKQAPCGEPDWGLDPRTPRITT